MIPLVILLFSAVLHEIMHGVVANRLGDPTAKLMGRLTLNPIPHIDPVMSILLPALMLIMSGGRFAFGAAKPVPINPIHFKDPKKDMALCALAGPLTNVAIAIIAAQIIKILPHEPFITPLLFMIVIYNLMLGIINLIPIPPLDGSRLLSAILPDELAIPYNSIERFGIFIIPLLIFTPIGGNLITNLLQFGITALGLSSY